MNSPGRNNGDPSSSGGSPHDDGFPAFVVPDDISALDAEVQAYRREVARARRRARLRAVLTAPLRRLGGIFRFFKPW